MKRSPLRSIVASDLLVAGSKGGPWEIREDAGIELVGLDFGFGDEAGLLGVGEYGVDLFVFEAVVDWDPEVACGLDGNLSFRVGFEVCNEFHMAVWGVLEREFFYDSSLWRLYACDAAGFMDV